MNLATRVLGESGDRTPLAVGLAAAGAQIGITSFNWSMLKSTRRRHWHLRGATQVPRPPLEARPALPVSEADEALCERLVAAYGRAVGEDAGGAQTSGLWSWIYETRQRSLAELLDRGDVRRVATELSSMFRKTFMLGIAPGSLKSHSESALGARIWRVRTLDGLVSLAEALGVAPVEDPVMGQAPRAFRDGLLQLVEGVERALGFSIDFPAVGAPHGVAVHGRLLTLDSPDQIYAAVRLDEALRVHLPHGAGETLRIVEIGGGYGGMCHWFLRRRPSIARYEIVDLPIVNVLQGYYLSRVLGEEAVSLFEEPPAQVAIVPSHALSAVDVPFDALVNKDSIPEMPEAAVLEYLSWARTGCEGVFFSCNHESQAPYLGEPLGLVPDLVERVGGFSRLRRDGSWVRPGYVEEVYTVSGQRDR